MQRSTSQENHAIIKAAQYLTSLSPPQDIWSEAGKVFVSFFNADLVAFGEYNANGQVNIHHSIFSDHNLAESMSGCLGCLGQDDSCQNRIGLEIAEAVTETLERGFLTSRVISTPVTLSLMFLPMTQEDRITSVMLVGHCQSESLPRAWLDVYLAVASLISLTAARLASEKELREQHQHIEAVFRERSTELTEANERLEETIGRHSQAEDRVETLNCVLYGIRNVSQLIIREKDRDRLLQGICQVLIETRGYHNAWIVLWDETEGLVTTVEAGLGEAFCSLVGQLECGKLTRCARLALTQSEVVVTEHPSDMCTDCPLAVDYLDRGGMTVRLEHSGIVYGLLSVCIPFARIADPREQGLLHDLAGDIAFALHNLALEEQHKIADDMLQKSENKYRRLHENMRKELDRVRNECERITRLATIGQVSGSIAHDLRNPLAVMHNATHLLKYYLPNPDEKLIRQFEVIDKEIQRSNQIITNLLDLASSRKPNKEVTSLQALLQEAVIETCIPEDISWQTITEPDPFMVYADPSQFGQVIRNLLINAVEAMAGTGKFIVQARQDESNQVIRFQDTGPGFSTKIKGDPLEPLITTKTTGIGLGLTICRDIIAWHGGTLTIEQDTKPEASICVTLPRA